MNISTQNLKDFTTDYARNTPLGTVSPTEVALEVTVLITLSLVGTVGNSLTLAASVTSPSLRTPLHMLLGHLMLCDLLLCSFVIPFIIYGTVNQGWYLPQGFCHFIGTVGWMVAHSAVHNTTLVALNRTSSCFPGHYLCAKLSTHRATGIYIIILWIFTFVISTPILFNILKVDYSLPYGTCVISNNNPLETLKMYVWMLGSSSSFVPITLTAILYITIFTRLALQKANFTHPHSRNMFVKVTKTMLLMFIWLCLCWLPESIHSFVDILAKAPYWVTRTCLYAILLHPAGNPLIYIWRMRDYRRTIQQLFRFRNNQINVESLQAHPSIPVIQVTSLTGEHFRY